MDSSFKILILEDNADDAGLIVRELKKAGIAFEYRHVDNKSTFIESFIEYKPDMVLSDYGIPGYSGMSALEWVRERNTEIPFVIVTGSINEETAVECMKSGADDYVLKERLVRLIPAVNAAIKKKQHAGDRAEMEAALHESESKYRSIYENSIEGIFRTTPEGRFIDVNPALARMFGYSSPEYMISSIQDIQSQIYADPSERAKFIRLMERDGYAENYEIKARRKDNSEFWLSINSRVVRASDGRILAYEGTSEDISERKYQTEIINRNLILQTAIAEISSLFVRPDDIDASINTTLEIIGNIVHADRAYFFRASENGLFYSNTHEWHENDIPSQKHLFQNLPTDKFTWWTEQMRNGHNIILKKIDHLPDNAEYEKAFLKQFSFNYLLATPVLSGNNLIGFIGFDTLDESRTLRENNALLMKLSAEILGNAIERQITEKALKESEEKYRKLFEQIPDSIMLFDEQGYVVDCNTGALKVGGYAKEDLIKKHFTELNDMVDQEEMPLLIQRFSEIIQAGDSAKFEHKGIIKSGNVRWLETQVTVIPKGEASFRIQTVSRDITERKKLEEAQFFMMHCGSSTPDEDFFLSLARYLGENLSMDFICIDRLLNNGLTAQTEAVWFDGRFEDNITYALKDTPCGDVLGKTICNFPAGVRHLFPKDEVLQQMEAESYIGTTLWSSTGQPVGLIAMISRKTLDNPQIAESVLKMAAARAAGELERKIAHEELLKSEERYRNTFDNMLEGAQTIDFDWNYVYINNVAAKHVRRKKEDLIGKKYTDIWPGAEDTEIFKLMKKCMEERTDQVAENEFVYPDGEKGWFDLSIQPVAEGIFILSSEITERKKAEEALRESEFRFRSLIKLAPVPMCLVNRDGKFSYLNDRFTQTLGYTLDDIPTIMDWWQLAYPDAEYRQKIIEIRQEELNRSNTETSHLTKIESNVTCKNGTISLMDISGINVGNSFLMTLIDYTERARAEEEKESLRQQLLQAQKMESIGTLAGGIAHDFNNMLAVIMGNAHMAKMKLKEKDPLFVELTEITNATDRAKDLTTQLLTFARKEKLNIKTVDISSVISDLSGVLSRSVNKKISIRTISIQSPAVTVDTNQLFQALLNICNNACDSMPGGGRLEIESSTIELDETYTTKHPDVRPGSYCRIRITDTGTGMTDEVKQRIFEPFFTTKAIGKGTGLGLSVTHGIIKSHNGHIEVESTPGEGTTFRIYIPILPIKEEIEKNKDAETILRGSETILIVDDEPVVAKVGEKMLKSCGYTALTAIRGKDALDIFSKNKDVISLVILDMIMPEMDGYEIYKALKLMKKDLKVLVASGYSSDGRVGAMLDDGVNGFIQKPFKITELSQAVRKVIDGSEI